MALDMEQLRKMFYEECRENLGVLEEVLLSLDPQNIEEETINTIFRAAHSIKGGAATFDLGAISEFTHRVEAYLDLVRNGEREMTLDTVDLLLKSCDCIQNMLEGYESGAERNETLQHEITCQLEQLLACQAETQHSQPEIGQSSTDSDVETHHRVEQEDALHWSITFAPHRELFFSGNDPLRILRELHTLDPNWRIEANLNQLPEMAEMEAELCFLSWHIIVNGKIPEPEIREIFEWVEDECDLAIGRLTPEEHELDGNQLPPQMAPERVAEVQQKSESNRPNVLATPHTDEVAESTEGKAVVSSKAKTSITKSEPNVSSIRVDIDKVDGLINLVGELVITQSMLTEIGNDFSMDKLDKLKAGLDQLLQNSKDLQENVLNIRMLPMSFAFSRFPRLVRDLSSRLEKSVDLQIQGEQTELDKTVLERIVDPLVHLVRNGIDHGIEQPSQRVELGKPELGTIALNAYHQGGAIIIEISDDGAGLNCDTLWDKAIEKHVVSQDARREDFSDKQIMNLIFAPGFSTADEVSDISGRGVGMDVVKRNITELGGHIEVASTLGQGSRFTISLPLTLAILDGQLIRVAGEVYVIPLLTIVESIQIDPRCIKHASGGVELYRLREENIPILRLQDELEMGQSGTLERQILCFVEAAGNRVGLLIDELLDQQQVVIKSLESNYTKVAGISGATILGDGSVSLILDIQGLIALFLHKADDSNGNDLAA